MTYKKFTPSSGGPDLGRSTIHLSADLSSIYLEKLPYSTNFEGTVVVEMKS